MFSSNKLTVQSNTEGEQKQRKQVRRIELKILQKNVHYLRNNGLMTMYDDEIGEETQDKQLNDFEYQDELKLVHLKGTKMFFDIFNRFLQEFNLIYLEMKHSKGLQDAVVEVPLFYMNQIFGQYDKALDQFSNMVAIQEQFNVRIQFNKLQYPDMLNKMLKKCGFNILQLQSVLEIKLSGQKENLKKLTEHMQNIINQMEVSGRSSPTFAGALPCARTHSDTRARTYARTHRFTHTHTRIHTHTDTHSHTDSQGRAQQSPS